ncbi:MAG: serine/threonine protein kinase, partial [Actinobacteria bacterium]|nr:serine/threonine protein kinase [Actinomycetota bacterium]
GVARVLDAEVEDDEAFVVTELIDGPTLEEDVAAHGPFAPDELRALAHGLADALHAIHRVGVVHRDLKPGNVMLSRTGPVIIDFGIAQVADDVRLTQTGMVAGTPGYLDPQVVDGAAPSPVCDWWAWSAVVVFAATGRRPFGTGPSAAVIKRMSLGQVDLEGVDPLVATALWAALQPDPASRLDPHSVLAVLDGRWDRQDLDEALASLRLRSPGEERTAVVPAAPAVMPATPQPTLTLPTTPQPTLVAPASSPHVDPGRQAPRPVPVQPAPASVAPVGPLRHEVAWQPVGPVDQVGDQRPGGGGEPDAAQEPPAWARPPVRRSGTVAALGIFLVAAAGIWPGVAILAFAAVLLLAGTVGYARRSIVAARWRRGPRPGDLARAVAASPWFLVRSTLVTVGLLLLSAGTAWVALQFASFLLPGLGQWEVIREHLLLWIGAAVAAAVTWFGPGAGVHREGARSLMGALLPYPAMRVALSSLSLLLGLGFLVATATGAFAGPVWEPLPTPTWLLL